MSQFTKRCFVKGNTKVFVVGLHSKCSLLYYLVWTVEKISAVALFFWHCVCVCVVTFQYCFVFFSHNPLWLFCPDHPDAQWSSSVVMCPHSSFLVYIADSQLIFRSQEISAIDVIIMSCMHSYKHSNDIHLKIFQKDIAWKVHRHIKIIRKINMIKRLVTLL